MRPPALATTTSRAAISAIMHFPKRSTCVRSLVGLREHSGTLGWCGPKMTHHVRPSHPKPTFVNAEKIPTWTTATRQYRRAGELARVYEERMKTCDTTKRLRPSVDELQSKRPLPRLNSAAVRPTVVPDGSHDVDHQVAGAGPAT